MADKILIVDDETDVETLMKQKFRKQLREDVFEFYFAQNGVKALEILKEIPDIKMVISDINMPEMDGLSLLKELEKNYPEVISIIVSAYGDMQNIRTAMNLGAFDFVTKPIDFKDLDLTIDKTIKTIGRLEESRKNRQQLELILHELNVAKDIQLSILPRKFINTEQIDIYAYMVTAKQVGGDFYDFFWLTPNKVGFVIADVSGKGVPAALFMTVTRTLLRGFAEIEPSVARCLTKVNRSIAAENDKMMFVTIFYGVLNIDTGELYYANAGHNPPYLLQKSGEIVEIASEPQTAVGIDPDLEYKEHKLTINPGDSIFVYTDGVTEAMDLNKKLFGVRKLDEVLQSNNNSSPKIIISKVIEAVSDFVNGGDRSDDITMLCLKFINKLI